MSVIKLVQFNVAFLLLSFLNTEALPTTSKSQAAQKVACQNLCEVINSSSEYNEATQTCVCRSNKELEIDIKLTPEKLQEHTQKLGLPVSSGAKWITKHILTNLKRKNINNSKSLSSLSSKCTTLCEDIGCTSAYDSSANSCQCTCALPDHRNINVPINPIVVQQISPVQKTVISDVLKWIVRQMDTNQKATRTSKQDVIPGKSSLESSEPKLGATPSQVESITDNKIETVLGAEAPMSISESSVMNLQDASVVGSESPKSLPESFGANTENESIVSSSNKNLLQLNQNLSPILPVTLIPANPSLLSLPAFKNLNQYKIDSKLPLVAPEEDTLAKQTETLGNPLDQFGFKTKTAEKIAQLRQSILALKKEHQHKLQEAKSNLFDKNLKYQLLPGLEKDKSIVGSQKNDNDGNQEKAALNNDESLMNAVAKSNPDENNNENVGKAIDVLNENSEFAPKIFEQSDKQLNNQMEKLSDPELGSPLPTSNDEPNVKTSQTLQEQIMEEMKNPRTIAGAVVKPNYKPPPHDPGHTYISGKPQPKFENPSLQAEHEVDENALLEQLQIAANYDPNILQHIDPALLSHLVSKANAEAQRANLNIPNNEETS